MATTSKKPARKSVSKKTKTNRKASASTARKTTVKKVTTKKNSSTVKNAKISSAKKSTVVPSSVSISKADASVVRSDKTPKSTKNYANDAMQKMRKLNFFVAFASVVQAALILRLSKAFGGIQSVHTSFPTNDSLARLNSSKEVVVTGAHRLFDLHLSWVIAAYFIVMALAHLSLATWLRRRYERETGAHLNRTRWASYAVSGSILLVAIALTAGIGDAVTLLSIVGFNVIASLVALSREHYTQNGERTRLVYGIGAVAGLAPWVILLVNLLGRHQYGEGSSPKYVWWIMFTGLVLVSALVKNLVEQTRARGRWIDYLYAEKVYIWLSLIGSSAIAWQIYSALLKK